MSCSSWNQVFTDIFLLAATNLIVPFSMGCQGECNTALSLPPSGFFLRAIPVEESDRLAVDVYILAFLYYVCYAYPEIFGPRWTAFGVVSQFIVFVDVSGNGQGSSLCDAVLISLMVMLGLLRKQVTLPMGFDATQANWKGTKIISLLLYFLL